MPRLTSRLDTTVLGIRDFRLLWSGQAVSATGDMIFPTAVAFRVLDAGGHAGDIGLVLAGRFAALVLFALFGGSGRTGGRGAGRGPAAARPGPGRTSSGTRSGEDRCWGWPRHVRPAESPGAARARRTGVPFAGAGGRLRYGLE